MAANGTVQINAAGIVVELSAQESGYKHAVVTVKMVEEYFAWFTSLRSSINELYSYIISTEFSPSRIYNEKKELDGISFYGEDANGDSIEVIITDKSLLHKLSLSTGSEIDRITNRLYHSSTKLIEMLRNLDEIGV